MLVLLLTREISGNLFLNFPNYKVLKAMCQTLSGWVYSVTPPKHPNFQSWHSLPMNDYCLLKLLTVIKQIFHSVLTTDRKDEAAAAAAAYLVQADTLRRWLTPSSSSIICWSKAWSLELIGAMEISRTARNWPQLFKCSFSRRKKFHTKRLHHHHHHHTTQLR